MSEPWTAERAVDPQLARELVASQFPRFEGASLEELGVGWDNTAYLFDRSVVFRFPRRQIAVELISTESRVLPAIAPHLPLAVPAPEWVGTPTERFPWPFAGYRWLAGETACRRDLSPEARAACAEPLGQFLHALHAVPMEVALGVGTPPDTIRRLDLPYRIGQLRERMASAHAKGLLQQDERLESIFERLPPGWTPGSRTLVHGDLYARHLLVDESDAPTAVIDWGDVHLGDPAVDLAIVPGFLPVSAHELFFEAYGSVDDATWRVARFRALLSAVAILVYGHDVGDAALEREGRIALELLASGS